MKQISIIIPTYNRALLLKEAIESVFLQTYKNFELIVVNDGSTDNTLNLLKQYGNRLRILNQENKGVSAARNLGIKNANGDLIAFLDSDDLWLPEKLKNQVNFFLNNLSALICQTQEIWIRNGIRVNPKKKHEKKSGMIFKNSLALCLVSPSAVMIHKKLFQNVGLFDESLPACEDYDLWLRISYKYPIYLIDKPLIIKRGGHDDQLSKDIGLDRYRIKAIKKIIDSGLLSKEQNKDAVETLIKKCNIYSKGCLKHSRIDEANFYENLKEKYI